MKNSIIRSYEPFNQRRYSSPWVAMVDDQGKPNFSVKVGTYSGNASRGESGDLIVFAPVEGQIYAYGQKDYRGKNTELQYVLWNGQRFVRCDKLGRII